MGDQYNKDIMARNIKKYMERKGVTNQQLCDALGFKYTTFMDWIKAVTYPRMGKVQAMADYFGVEKSDLIEEKPVNQEINELTEKDYEYIERIKKFSPEKQRLLDIFLTGLEHDQ